MRQPRGDEMSNMTDIKTSDLVTSAAARGSHHRVAILIPCLNEARTVGGVIADFRRELPDAAIWVIDNNSTDNTGEMAAAAGAKVMREPRAGKGFAIRLAFRDIDADVYVLVDGDNQLPAERVHDLIAPVLYGGADMVVGSRTIGDRMSPRFINNLGNILFSRLLRSLLGVRVTDVLSGYRAMSWTLVKSLPLASRTFEIEVELTIKTAQRSYRIQEVPIAVKPRPPETTPHLRVYRDGLRIGWAIVQLFRDYRPMMFFGLLGSALTLVGLLLVAALGPEAIGFTAGYFVAVMLVAAGFLSIAAGMVVSVLARRFQELEEKLDTLAMARHFSDRADS